MCNIPETDWRISLLWYVDRHILTMKLILRTSLFVAVCLCLTSCFGPEKFTATLNVDKKGDFQFTYDGTVVYGLALVAIKGQGRLDSKDDAACKDLEADLRKEPGMKSVEYIGNGRYKIRAELSGSVYSKKIFFDLIEMMRFENGGIVIFGPEISSENNRELASLNLALDGQLKVTSDLRVIEHNASSTPMLGGAIGSYEWKIRLPQNERPKIMLMK